MSPTLFSLVILGIDSHFLARLAWTAILPFFTSHIAEIWIKGYHIHLLVTMGVLLTFFPGHPQRVILPISTTEQLGFQVWATMPNLLFLVFWKSVSLCSSGWLRIQYYSPGHTWSDDPIFSASGNTDMHHHAWLTIFYFLHSLKFLLFETHLLLSSNAPLAWWHLILLQILTLKNQLSSIFYK
jgi:hypothetical protein